MEERERFSRVRVLEDALQLVPSGALGAGKRLRLKVRLTAKGQLLADEPRILENADVKSMGYNSPRYTHAVYQAMNLAFADRDFYYGDPYFPPEEPISGLLNKDYARDRAATIQSDSNDPAVKPGDAMPRGRPRTAVSRRIRRMSRTSASASTNTFTSHRSRTRASASSGSSPKASTTNSSPRWPSAGSRSRPTSSLPSCSPTPKHDASKASKPRKRICAARR